MRKKTMASGWLALAARNCAMTGVVPSLDGTASAFGGWTRGAFMRAPQGEGLQPPPQASCASCAALRQAGQAVKGTRCDAAAVPATVGGEIVVRSGSSLPAPLGNREGV